MRALGAVAASTAKAPAGHKRMPRRPASSATSSARRDSGSSTQPCSASGRPRHFRSRSTSVAIAWRAATSARTADTMRSAVPSPIQRVTTSALNAGRARAMACKVSASRVFSAAGTAIHATRSPGARHFEALAT